VVSEELRDRTFRFALDAIAFCRGLPETWEARRIRGQLFACSTAVGANYRAAGRARSDAEFIAKLGTVVEEADESQYWLELLHASGIDTTIRNRTLAKEAAELRAIFVASRKTAMRTAERKRQQRSQRRPPLAKRLRENS
jgi:four helix bundle protein